MKLGLNTYSLRNEWDALGRAKVDIIIDLCKDLGITELELLDREVNPETIKEDIKKIQENGIHVNAFGPHTHLLAKTGETQKEINDGKYWIDLAAENGVKYLRMQGGDGPLMKLFQPMDDFDEEEWEEYEEAIDAGLKVTSEVLDPLLKYAEEKGVYIAFETHGSYSSNYMYMKKFNEKFKSKHIGWALDVGNFENDKMRMNAVEELKNNTFYLHAKSHKYDENGFEIEIDYPKICKILNDAGNTDLVWSIEFEGRYNGILGVYQSAELIKYSFAQLEGKEYKINTDLPSVDELMKKYGK